MLREEVGRVLRAVHLPKLELLPAQPLLYPEAVALQVPQLAQALSGGSAHGGRTVRPHSKWEVKSCVSAQGLLAQAYARAPYYAVVLCFAATESKRGLRSRPTLDHMSAKHEAPT